MAIFKGMAFPFKQSSVGFPAQVEDAALIRQSVIQIIMTPRGTRIMRPDFGASVLDFVFENNDELLVIQIQREVRAALGKWEPRIVVTRVDVVRDADQGEVSVTIHYVIRALSSPDKVSITLAETRE